MDPHPIPQNVTSFQFKLVGDMTLKQFIYLASGLGIAYLTFVFGAASFPVLAWPVVIISASLGTAFAFLPVGDRSLDRWIVAFLRAVYSPTKMIWLKNGHPFSEEPLFKTRLSIFLGAQGFTQPPPQLLPVTSPTPSQPLPSQEELSQTVKLAREAHSLQQQIIQTEKNLAQIKAVSTAPGVDPETYTNNLNAILNNLQRLIKETTDIQDKLGSGRKEPQRTVKVEIITPSPKPKVQISLTSLPNVINGIIVDSENNYLPDVVVVVHDRYGLPVRALKTNKLGQFTGATPLPNGTYTVELEKETQVFDILKIELDGKILPTLKIAAKKVAGNI